MNAKAKKTKTLILNIVSVLYGLMMLNAGLSKFFKYMPEPETISSEMAIVNEAFATICWLMPLIGIAEIVGAILIIIPKTRALGAIVLFPIMIGIFLYNFYYQMEAMPITIILWLIQLWIMWESRKKYKKLLS